MRFLIIPILFAVLLGACNSNTAVDDNNINHKVISKDQLRISRQNYHDKLYGFWLGQCIANWTGLITEMDKIGNVGEIKTGDFYPGRLGKA